MLIFDGDLPINSTLSFNLISLKPRSPRPELVALVPPPLAPPVSLPPPPPFPLPFPLP